MSLKEAVSNRRRWDFYFWNLCQTVGANSPCLSRKIGAILVRDNIVVATGYNGPPRGVPHCGLPRLAMDEKMATALKGMEKKAVDLCPRQVLGHPSGTHLEMCTATHAEVNCIINAARVGVQVKGTTMYMNCIVSCRECLKVIINSGIKSLVVDSFDHYDDGSEYLLKTSNLNVRLFMKGEE